MVQEVNLEMREKKFNVTKYELVIGCLLYLGI
jgi:hypothetical protein